MKFKATVMIECSIDLLVLNEEKAKEEMNDNNFIPALKNSILEVLELKGEDYSGLSIKIPTVKAGLYED